MTFSFCRYPSVGCGASEATGPGFVCFVVFNPRVLQANRVDLGLFWFIPRPNCFSTIQAASPCKTEGIGYYGYEALLFMVLEYWGGGGKTK
mgnify:CR=1 FL=1